MRAMVIVIVTPGRDQLSGVAQVIEQVLVQALVPEAAIEADQVTQYIDPRFIQTSFTYNWFGETVQKTSADRGTISNS